MTSTVMVLETALDLSRGLLAVPDDNGVRQCALFIHRLLR